MPLKYGNILSYLDRNFNLSYSKVCESDEIYWILLSSLAHFNENMDYLRYDFGYSSEF